ncbi:DUF1822 family protein [Stenomitos frigidus]|uniref:DUF1822 domain-containing protein n=1 Tax=Stenomitos frigidus ULC18 TaxID=2107698 RepID=A0A2T1DSN6_9CYAN|nr:DUF1822 family protein [Stenomitos frigidus]PSB23490.1 hypothetical protein C7B82_30965 [Stenomitos frigidus ULC18]
MINPPTHSTDPLDWEFLVLDNTELTPEQVEQAVQISQTVHAPMKQWPVYLQALALIGFQEWLAERAPDLDVTDTHCSILQPQYANLIEAVCNLQVGAFSLCLMTIGSVTDALVSFPRAVMDVPQFAPHLYVLMQVLEEEMQVQVYGYLRSDQVAELQRSHALQASSNWTYTLPVSWFNPDETELLLDLRCLEPQALPRLTASPALLPIAEVQKKLTNLLPQLQSPQCSLSQLLTWEEGATILTFPELADWLYRVQSGAAVGRSASLAPKAEQTQPLINVGLWFHDRLDTIAQELAWVLMPAFAQASALRSMEEELENRGIRIPPEARGAYQDVQLGNASLRIHVITWVISLTTATQGWTLLIILGAQPNTRLPIGTRLLLRDETQPLVEQVLQEDAPNSYLYAQVGGTWNERFWVTIELMDTVAMTLPPFTFNDGNDVVME